MPVPTNQGPPLGRPPQSQGGMGGPMMGSGPQMNEDIKVPDKMVGLSKYAHFKEKVLTNQCGAHLVLIPVCDYVLSIFFMYVYNVSFSFSLSTKLRCYFGEVLLALKTVI